MPFNIFEVIANEIEEFNHPVTITDGYDFSQKNTVNLIDLYSNSQFKYGNRDSEGRRKFFLNTCRFRADVGAKQVDMGLRDFVFIPENGESVWPVWFYQKEFRMWAKDASFSSLINEIVEDYPKYGSAVIKRVGRDLARVPVSNLRNNQAVRHLRDGWVHEDHEYSPEEFLKEAKARGWNIEKAKEIVAERTQKARKEQSIRVVEREGLAPESWVDEQNERESSSEEIVRVLAIVVLDETKNARQYPQQFSKTGKVLFAEVLNESRYWDVHWRKIDGRWLGVGEIESQFENQVSRNELNNLKRKALYWSAKQVYQSPDDFLAKNLVTEVKDGDVLKVSPNGQITKVNMQNTALPEFNQAEQELENNSNQISFTHEIATGETMPSGTPFRLGVILERAVIGHFSRRRENLALFFKEILLTRILPNLARNWSKEHQIEFFDSPDEIEVFDEFITRMWMSEAIRDYVERTGFYPNYEEMARERSKLQESLVSLRSRNVKLPEGFYQNIKYKLEIPIGGEGMDTEKKMESYTTLFQTLAQNPQIIEHPVIKEILKRIMALTGENLSELLRKAQNEGTVTIPQVPGIDRVAAQLGNPTQPAAV